MRLVARLNGQWVEIGPKITQPVQPGIYDWDVDLCTTLQFNGPLEVALRIWDHEGNVAAARGPRTIQVDHACPPPTSQLKPAGTFDSTAVRLSWDAASAGVNIGSFDLQWRSEPGSWNAANTLTLPGGARSTWYLGQAGGSYAFRLRALDANGQPEPWPGGGAFETSATLPASCNPDSSEPYDNLNQASMLPLDTWVERNLCQANDPDWFRIEIGKESDYAVTTRSLYGGAAVRITVYAEDGSTVLANGQAAGVGQAASVVFQAAGAGTYFIKIEPLTANLFGTDALYDVSVYEIQEVFLPLVAR